MLAKTGATAKVDQGAQAFASQVLNTSKDGGFIIHVANESAISILHFF